MRGRIAQDGVRLGGLAAVEREWARCRRLLLTGCGTAWHAGLVGEYLFEELARVPTEVEYASELRYRNPIFEEGTLVLAISQSGETADTLAALREMRTKGATVLGLVNAVGSSIARETDAGVYLHVGPEIGVASTKAFTAQIAVLALMATDLGRRRHLSPERTAEILEELGQIPDKVARTLELEEQTRELATRLAERQNWLYMGRGVNYPVALEGALKLKEISYIHAEGLPAAEMKHGPIALIDEGMPVIVVAPQDSTYEKVLANVEEVHSRGGRIIAVATEGDTRLEERADQVLHVPATLAMLSPILTTIPLQLLAYHAALVRGHDVDKPRNLAKSVTVE
jgi:glucosamine--fructose-6-phosphate aminotransferase (isomerizing)